jgi:Na+/H+-translocating membrane pyrophosphatase
LPSLAGLGSERFIYNLLSTLCRERGGPVDGVAAVNGLPMEKAIEVLAGFSLGAESMLFLPRVGGGIYTKAADVGADLVGKVEAGIPKTT